MKTLSIVIGIILLITALGGLVMLAPMTDDDGDRLGIIVTISPQKEFARQVGGDRLKITVMVPSGEDPHTYEPTTGQMKDVARAELYFKVGSGVEFEKVWMDTITEQNPDMFVVDGHEGIELIPINGEAGEYNLTGVAEDLFEYGPFKDVPSGRNNSDAPAIEGGDRCFNISFNQQGKNEGDGNWSGVLKFDPGEQGEFVVFLEHDVGELNFTFKNEEGREIEPGEQHEREQARHEDEEDEEDHHFEWYGTFDLEEDNHTLEFGPTGKESCKVVILEKHGEEHYHDETGGVRGAAHDHGALDPHIWMSPRNARVMVLNLLDGLIEIDPENAAYYTANGEEYLARLDDLHDNMTENLDPYRGKKFMVYHPAFGYLAHEYGLTQLAVEDDGKEPTQAGLQSLIEQAREEDIGVIFVSPQFNEHNARVIADEIDGHVVSIDSLAGNYLENMQLISEKLTKGFE